MGVGQKAWSSVDRRVTGKELGVDGTMWVGGVGNGHSVDIKVGSVDIVSSDVGKWHSPGRL